MKKFLIISISLILVGLGTVGGITIYKKYFKEYLETVDIELEVYNEYKLLDFNDKFSCDLNSEEILDTEKVTNYTIEKHCRNSEKKKIKLLINVKVIDTVAPIIILKDSYSVTEGYERALTDVIISADNYDAVPKREIIGDYDLNTVGSYNVTYKVTDNSGNETSKDFVLNVIPKPKNNNSNNNDSYIAFSDIFRDYKTENTEIGIDVSKWQGNIDFSKVKEAGASFVIIRLGHQDGFDGEYIKDPYFEQNINNALENGLKVGVYFYTYANSHDEAKKQAAWISDNLKDYTIDLPVAYDWESWSNFNSLNLSLHEFNAIANTYMEELEENNYVPILYSSKNYLENIWTNSKYKTWLAHYTYNTNYEGDYYLWQMCSDGRISGINGYVDIDILYK